MGWTADRTDLTADSTLITADGYEPTEEECVWTADSTDVTADSTAQTADGYDPLCECTWTADSTTVTADSTTVTADGYDPLCDGETPEEEQPSNLGLGDDELWMLRQDDEIILAAIKEFVRMAA